MWLDTQSINLFFYVQGHCVFFPLSPAPNVLHHFFFLDEKSFYTGRTVFSSVHTFVWISFVQVGIKSGGRGLKFDICISKHQNKKWLRSKCMGAFGCSVDEFIKTQVVLLLGYNRGENDFFFPYNTNICTPAFISNMLSIHLVQRFLLSCTRKHVRFILFYRHWI